MKQSITGLYFEFRTNKKRKTEEYENNMHALEIIIIIIETKHKLRDKSHVNRMLIEFSL